MDDHSDLPWKPTNVKEDPDAQYIVPVVLVGGLLLAAFISACAAALMSKSVDIEQSCVTISDAEGNASRCSQVPKQRTERP